MWTARYQTIGRLLVDLRRLWQHPDEDFVAIAPLVDNGRDQGHQWEELKQIKEHGDQEQEHASKLESSYHPDEGPDDEDEDENEGTSPSNG